MFFVKKRINTDMNDSMNSFEDDDLNDIVSQIKNQSRSLKRVEKEYPTLKKDDLEQFIIENASKVIIDSVDMIQDIKNDIVAEDSKGVEAVSELVKAVTGAIDALSKLKLSDDKIKAQKELKEMEISSKVNMLEDKANGTIGISISREELLKHLNPFKKDKTTEPLVIEVDQSSDN